MNNEKNVSYLGVVGLGKVTPIRFGEVTNSIFIEITNADVKDGFLVEYYGIKQIYEYLMRAKNSCSYSFSSEHQTFTLVNNWDMTELVIEFNSWNSNNCSDIKELEDGLQVQIPDKYVMLIPTKEFVKKLFKIITAKERRLFAFS